MNNILVVDDEPTVRAALKRFLTRHNFNVTEAEQGEEGIAIIEEGGIDLVIMDIQMPVKGGIETLLQLRKDFSDLKIILISGKMPAESQALTTLVKQFGVEHFLFKPFSNKELLKRIDSLQE